MLSYEFITDSMTYGIYGNDQKKTSLYLDSCEKTHNDKVAHFMHMMLCMINVPV